jgi:hypothetical protein
LDQGDYTQEEPVGIAEALRWLVDERNITEEAATSLLWDAVEKGELGINSACEIYPLFKSEDQGYEESLEI